MGGTRRFKPSNLDRNGPPIVVALVGDHEKGLVTLETCIALALKGIHVHVFFHPLLVDETYLDTTSFVVKKKKSEWRQKLIDHMGAGVGRKFDSVSSEMVDRFGVAVMSLGIRLVMSIDALMEKSMMGIDVILDGLIGVDVCSRRQIPGRGKYIVIVCTNRKLSVI